MFNQFPRNGKIACAIMLTGIVGFLVWFNVRPPKWNDGNYGLKPGSKKYKIYHGDNYDTISQWTADHDTTTYRYDSAWRTKMRSLLKKVVDSLPKDTAPGVIMHNWYRDSNNVWHEDNENCHTDSSEYLKH